MMDALLQVKELHSRQEERGWEAAATATSVPFIRFSQKPLSRLRLTSH